MLTNAEYEDAYAEALRCLKDDEHVVSEAFIDRTGAQYCIVDARKLTDEAALELWWEAEIAREILEGRSATRR